MAYTVNKTDGTVLATVLEGTADTSSSSLVLIGKNYANYGEKLNENFVKLLENFAYSTEPSNPIKGQLWYDTSSDQLKAYDGTDFILVGPADSTTPLTAASATISGNLTVDGDASFNANLTIGDVLYVGANAPSWATSVNLTDEIAVMYKSANAFVQSALHNASDGTEASTDFIAYMDSGDNQSGWIDMGITSSNFVAPVFGITNAGDGYIFMSAPDGGGLGGNLVIATDSTGTQNDIIFATNGFTSTTEQGRFISDDGFQVKGNLISINGAFFQGQGARDLLLDDSQWSGYIGLTDVSGVFVQDQDAFVQLALKNLNNGESASTDLIAYASDGDNDSGWIDLGITSETFNDVGFTVTGPGTGYLFMSAPASTAGTGDLLIGTDSTGSQNDIVFFTNGFDAGNERVRIVGQSRVGDPAGVEVYISTDSTSTSTGALRVSGGIGLLGNLNVGGDVNIVGNITLGGGGNTVETETLAVANPIVFTGSGNPANLYDIGLVGEYTSSGTKYTGFVKDATDGYWKLFKSLATLPTTTVDFSSPTYDSIISSTHKIVGELSIAETNSTIDGRLLISFGGSPNGVYYNNRDNSNLYFQTQGVTRLTVADSTGNLTASGSIIATGSLTANVASGSAIINAGTAGVGNIGASGQGFNTVFAKATSAQYADLAEKYLADADYEIGTVVAIGGTAEVTACKFGDRAIGTVSANPAYMMNSDLDGGTYIALKGRVPIKVTGAIKKGQRLVASENGCAIMATMHQFADVFAIALESNDDPGVKIIEGLVL